MNYLHTVEVASGGMEGSIWFHFKVVTKTNTAYTSVKDITNDINNIVSYECTDPLVGDEIRGYDDWAGGAVKSAIYQGGFSITSEKIIGGNIAVTSKSDKEYTATAVVDAFTDDTVTEYASKVNIDLTTLSGYESLAAGSYQLAVRAKASGYTDSDLSSTVSFTKLAAPTITASDTTVTWDAITNAESYDVYVDGELYENTTGGSSGETWVLNESITLPTGRMNVTFNSASEYFAAIDTEVLSGHRYLDYVDEHNDFTPVYSQSAAAWVNRYGNDRSAYRTITFTQPVTNSTLLAWLQANGTKQ